MLRSAPQRPARQGHRSRKFLSQEHPGAPSYGGGAPRGRARERPDVTGLASVLRGKIPRMCSTAQWSQCDFLDRRGCGRA
eukprot:5886248-Amphidinium_carterae.1